MCIHVCEYIVYIYQRVFNAMDSIPIINDNGSQCLRIDYISGTVAGSFTHDLIESTHWLHTGQLHTSYMGKQGQRGQATCPSL